VPRVPQHQQKALFFYLPTIFNNDTCHWLTFQAVSSGLLLVGALTKPNLLGHFERLSNPWPFKMS
jgi:hypothetical protein